MKRTTNRRKGFTLAELAVVLAVLAIVITMVASFDALMHQRRKVSQAKLDVMNDIKLAEALIENFLEENKISNINNGANDVADTKITASEKVLEFSNHTLKVGTSEIMLEKVTDVRFDSFVNDEGKDNIYFCTIEYTLPGKDVPETYTFCVDPSIGETDGGSGE